MRKSFRNLLGVWALTLLFGASCWAQFNAGIQGTVQDPKGAVIPNATVSLVNDANGVRQTALSGANGVYRFTSLAAGNYTVSTTVSGFSPASTKVVLTANQLFDIPLVLSVASASSSVTVNTQAPLLDTSDSRSEETLNTTALEDLPLPGRNPTNVLTVAPGVTGLGGQSSPGASTSTNFAPENWVDASANGRGANGNLYIVDGMDVTSFIRPGVLNLTPNADSLQEVSVQTNTYTVDYGRSSSIQTVMTSKSGTNQYHGLASDYYQSQQLQARGEFGIPSGTPLPSYHTNNFSFAIGGPVIPHREFFFFAGYEPYYSVASQGSSLTTYEDPEFVKFAQSVRPDSGETQIMAKYPASAATTVGVNSTAGQLWSNTLPAAQQAQCEAGVGDLGAAYDNIPCGTPVLDTGRFTPSSVYNAKQYNIRLDKYFPKDRIFGNFYRNSANTGGPNVRPAFNTTSDFFVFNLQANETHTFSSSMLNEAIFGYARIEGFANKTGLFTVPIVSVDQLGNGFGDGFAQGDYIQHSYHWRDVLTKVVGSHSVKAGLDIWRGDDDVFFQGPDGIPNLHYTNLINFINDDIYSESGLSYNVVTGKPVPYTYGYKKTTLGIFAEDSWKASRKLTINYGIRYDNNGNPYVDEALPGKSSGAPPNVISNMTLGSGSNFAAKVADASFKVQLHVYPSDRNWIFSPRVGLAYDPTTNGKWVIRGGVGLFHDLLTLGNEENLLGNNAPGPTVPTFFGNGSTAPPSFGLGTQNHYPYGFDYPAFVGTPLDSHGGIVGSNISMGAVQQNLSIPNTLVWSAAVERQITSTLTASLGYSGTHSSKLVVVGGNTGDTSYTSDVNLSPGDLIRNPAFDSSGNWTGTGIQTRLNPSFGRINYEFNGARANYNAFIAAVRGRFGKHGFLTASYTRSASKDNSTNYPDGYTGAGGGVNYNIDQFYSPSNWDVPNRVSMGSSYDVPGLNGRGGLVRRLTSGFNLASTLILQSGRPFYVTSGNSLSLVDSAGTAVTSANYASELSAGNITFAGNSGNYSADGDNGSDVPDVLSYHQKHDRKSYQFTGMVDSGIISHSQFAAPKFSPSGAQGNEKMNAFRNPGYADVDLTGRKRIEIKESMSLEFRVDVFNLFNRVNLNGVNANFNDTSAGFGTTGSSLPPRYMQLGTKFAF
ncbi:MAG: TonB-dependent receptor [Acidobacteria bacterium]|nr:TonB-dependent receptor [Acidobacteriota bacterium]